MRDKFVLRSCARTRKISICGLFLAGTIVLAACTTEGVLRPEVGIGTGASSVRPKIDPKPSGLLHRVGFPSLTRTQLGIMPEEELQCRTNLRKLGVSFRDLPPIDDGGGCGIDYPIEVTGLPRGIELAPAATLNCTFAETFARWTKKELNPASKRRYFSGIRKIRQGSSYSCRTIGNKRGGRLSEHAKGNALDVMDVTLKNGKKIDVRKPGLFSFRQRGLLNSVRGDACSYFSTVLGPGYNRAHKDHFHFDLMERRSGHKACR